MSLVVVAAGIVAPYLGAETAFTLRVLTKKTFVDSDGATHLSFEEHPDEVHREVACTVSIR
jgi:pimeloyl-ACP methyl ester carboxylesterase